VSRPPIVGYSIEMTFYLLSLKEGKDRIFFKLERFEYFFYNLIRSRNLLLVVMTALKFKYCLYRAANQTFIA
jgi:hypothetical protein